MTGKSAGLQTILGANGTIGVPLAKELSAYTDRIRLVSRNPKKVNATDEIFPADSGKFAARFGFRATPYAEGVKATINPASAPVTVTGRIDR